MKINFKVVFMAFFATLLLSLAVLLWPRPRDRSVVVGKVWPTKPNVKVENGTAYDRAVVNLTSYDRMALPDNAQVTKKDGGDTLEIYMGKTLGFYGHPPRSMSIADARKYMGCASRDDAGRLLIATFGEWTSKEGGAEMSLLFVVPKRIDVEMRPGLSGPDSKGREWFGQYLTAPEGATEGFWYGPVSPAPGWHKIEDRPDPQRNAPGGG